MCRAENQPTSNDEMSLEWLRKTQTSLRLQGSLLYSPLGAYAMLQALFWNLWYSKAHLVDKEPVDSWTDCHTNCQVFRETIRPLFAYVMEHIKDTEDEPDTDCTDLTEWWVYIFRILYCWGGRGLMWIIRGWKFQKCDSFWQQFPSLHLFIEGRKTAILAANLRGEEKLYQQQFIFHCTFSLLLLLPEHFQKIFVFSVTVLAGSLPILSSRRDWFNDYSPKDR